MSIPSDATSTQRHEYLPDDRERLEAAQRELERKRSERTRRGRAASEARIKPAASLIEAAVSASTKPSRRRRATAPTPPSPRPTLEQLVAWLPECPPELLAQMRDELKAFVTERGATPPPIVVPAGVDTPMVDRWACNPIDPPSRDVVSVEMPPLLPNTCRRLEFHPAMALEVVRQRKPVLLEVMIAHHQKLVELVMSDAQHMRVPSDLYATRHITYREARDDQTLLFAPEELEPITRPRFEMAYLPGLEPPPSKLIPTPLLAMFGLTGPDRRGAVPFGVRLGWEVLFSGAVPAGRIGVYRPTLKELWNRVCPATKYVRSRSGRQLYQGARWLNDPDHATMWRTGDAAILLVTFRAVPTPPYPADQQVLLEIAHPPNANGAMVDRHLMRTLANASYRQFRAYVSTCCLVDRYGTQRGQLIHPESPEGESHYAWLEGDDIILLTHHQVADTKARQRGQRQKSLDTVRALQGLGVINYRVRIGSRNEIEALQPLPSPTHAAAYAHLSSRGYPQGSALLST